MTLDKSKKNCEYAFACTVQSQEYKLACTTPVSTFCLFTEKLINIYLIYD